MELILPLVIIVVFMVFLTRGQRKQQKQAKEFRQNLQVGDEVMTQSGMLGVVVELDDKEVTVESTHENYTRWVRAAVGPVPPQAQPPAEGEEESDTDDLSQSDSGDDGDIPGIIESNDK